MLFFERYRNGGSTVACPPNFPPSRTIASSSASSSTTPRAAGPLLTAVRGANTPVVGRVLHNKGNAFSPQHNEEHEKHIEKIVKKLVQRGMTGLLHTHNMDSSRSNQSTARSIPGNCAEIDVSLLGRLSAQIAQTLQVPAATVKTALLQAHQAAAHGAVPTSPADSTATSSSKSSSNVSSARSNASSARTQTSTLLSARAIQPLALKVFIPSADSARSREGTTIE